MQNRHPLVVLIIVVAAGLVSYVEPAFSAPAGILQTTTPTPDPTMTGIYDTVATQQHQIERLQTELEQLRNGTEDQLRDYRWIIESNLFKLSVTLAAIGLILAYVGITTYSGIEQKIQSKISSLMDKEIFRVDPTMKRIHVPQGRDELLNILTRSGLKNTTQYIDLSKANTIGITIAGIDSLPEELVFRKYLNTYRDSLRPERAAFILYAQGGYRIQEETLKLYENLTIANMPVTVVAAILAVSRGLIQ